MNDKNLSEELADYGSWVSKRLVFMCFAVTSIPMVIVLFPIFSFLKVILLILGGILLVFAFYIIFLYRVYNKNDREFPKKVRNIVLDNLMWDGNGKLLDIGTGRGPIAIMTAKKFPEASIMGIDYWKNNWHYSKEICEKNANIEGVSNRTSFQKANAANLPFNDEEFDAVVSNLVFHEVREAKNKQNVIKEALRMVKDGGSFSFQDFFLSKSYYGSIERTLEEIREWGISEVNFKKAVDLIKIPKLLLFEKQMGIIYGKK